MALCMHGCMHVFESDRASLGVYSRFVWLCLCVCMCLWEDLCLCDFLCFCICLYSCVSVCLCEWPFSSLCRCVYQCLFQFFCAIVCLLAWLYTSLCKGVFVLICIFFCGSVCVGLFLTFASVYMWMPAPVCLFPHVSCACLHVSLWGSVFLVRVCVPVFLWLYMCVALWVFVGVCGWPDFFPLDFTAFPCSFL